MNHSKFLAPQPTNVLARERLINRLGAWDDKKLVIIHAQAGQGKSTLAAGFAASLPLPTVWYAMDAGDDDPAVFLSCLAQALQSALPEHFPKFPPPPRIRYGARGSEPAITRWVGQMFGGLNSPCLIVFDDYHLTAASSALRSILKTLFEGTPAAARFMLLSRTRPELDIAKLRSRRSMAELRGSDLKFSDQEAQELFGGVFGMPLAEAEAAAVNRTAEGWPAGLVLLHGFLMNVPRQDRLAALAGRQQLEFRTHIFDYLAQEVFSHLPQDLQDFLLHTAVADHLTRPLMSALTGLPETAPDGKPSVSALVRELSARNLFISSVDADGSVIRYHALFREFLLKTFQAKRSSREVNKQFAVAARWFKTAGDPVRAIDLWIGSGQE
ncbi:MAG: ATP-dependent transcriptional regulator, partial [Nitrospirae bacterium]|nr:ATP-dependent transcriptional regulator [Nitrospirota bacterium]